MQSSLLTECLARSFNITFLKCNRVMAAEMLQMPGMETLAEKLRDFYHVKINGMHKHNYVLIDKEQDYVVVLNGAEVRMEGDSLLECVSCETAVLVPPGRLPAKYEKMSCIEARRFAEETFIAEILKDPPSYDYEWKF